eukprot:COSAG06_NODE_69720_length_196_cov_28.917526_1_plen_62_part_01
MGALSHATPSLVCVERPPDADATLFRDQVPETVSVFAVAVFEPRENSFPPGFAQEAAAALSS